MKTNIEEIRIVHDIETANKLLKSGWRYIETIAGPAGHHIVLGKEPEPGEPGIAVVD